MIPRDSVWASNECEECGNIFQHPRYATANIDRCQACEQIYQLRRIADVLEYWVGMQ